MALIGTIEPAIGKGEKIVALAPVGPASYLAGGFTIDTGLSTLEYFEVTPDDATLAAASDTGYAITQTASGGVITVVVWYFAGAAWTQIANAVNLSGITFNTLAIGY